MKTIPFWTDEYPRPADLPTAPLPNRADVAVVGSGYTGLNAALALAKAGASVAVLEKETIGWGASSRNGGMLTLGLKESIETIARREGLEKARAFWQWSIDSIAHVEHVVEAEDIACDFSRTGHVLLAHKPAHFAAFEKEIAWKRTHLGYEGDTLVPPTELRDELDTPAFHGGLANEASAALHPAKYVFGLARAAARHGANLVENAEVTAIRRQKNGFTLTVAQPSSASPDSLQAGEVLLATNGYTTGLVRPIRSGIFPVGSYIITTPPLSPALQASVSPKGRMFFDSKHFLNYFRLIPDGRMLFGGRNNLSTGLDLHESARLLQARMLEVYPQLAGQPLTHSWTGQLGVPFDLMPHAGRLRGIHFAYGYAGHGVAIASYLGKEMGLRLAGHTGRVLFAEIRHPRSFIAHYEKRYLPLVAAWYRFLDWAF